MCIFSLDQTKLWIIIFIIIKQSPMCISRICGKLYGINHAAYFFNMWPSVYCHDCRKKR